MVFPTPEESLQYKNDEMTIREWSMKLNRYISETNCIPGYWSKHGIYIMESADLTTSINQEMTFTVIVSHKYHYIHAHVN